LIAHEYRRRHGGREPPVRSGGHHRIYDPDEDPWIADSIRRVAATESFESKP
jgi:hypothetical protein